MKKKKKDFFFSSQKNDVTQVTIIQGRFNCEKIFILKVTERNMVTSLTNAEVKNCSSSLFYMQVVIRSFFVIISFSLCWCRQFLEGKELSHESMNHG